MSHSSPSSSSVSSQNVLEAVLDDIFNEENQNRREEILTVVFESGPFKELSGSSFQQGFRNFVGTIFQNGEKRRTYARCRRRLQNNVTALHFAAGLGLPCLCQDLVQIFGYDVNAPSSRNGTPLIIATWKNHISTVETLINLGANINIEGGSPLHIAARRGPEELVRLLISKGANTGTSSPFGTPLQCAAGAARQGNLEILLDNNVDVNAVSSECWLTPLHLAVQQNSIECVKLLLTAGAQTRTRAFGTTPLCDAASHGTSEMVLTLLMGGADPNDLDMYIATPLENAILACRYASARMLLPRTHIFSLGNLTQVNGYINSLGYVTQRRKRKEQVFKLAKEEGNQAFNDGKYLNAVHCCAAAICANPYDATAYANRSLSYARLYLAEAALIDAQRCRRLRPDWAQAHKREAAAWELLEDYPKALEGFSNALRLEPGNHGLQSAIRRVREAMTG